MVDKIRWEWIIAYHIAHPWTPIGSQNHAVPKIEVIEMPSLGRLARYEKTHPARAL